MNTRLPCPVHGFHTVLCDADGQRRVVSSPPKTVPYPVLIPEASPRRAAKSHAHTGDEPFAPGSYSPSRAKYKGVWLADGGGAFASLHRAVSGEERVRTAIQHAIDYGQCTVDLSGSFSLQDSSPLRVLPPEIGELRHLTVLPPMDHAQHHQPSTGLQLFLGFNLLRDLPIELYDLQNMTVLGLQNNQLTEISFRIRQLTRLERLNLCGNQLETLPGELLMLPNLQSLTVLPNPLHTYTVLHQRQQTLRPSLAARSHCRPAWIARLNVNSLYLRYETLPTLVELSARRALLYPDDLNAVRHCLPDRLRGMLDEAMHRRCIACGSFFLRAGVKIILWLDYLGLRDVPFLFRFCSVACLERPGNLQTRLERGFARRPPSNTPAYHREEGNGDGGGGDDDMLL
ncbi:hypothetical protein SYNPS1DRAFT_27131 [Syncephalis pseudoplumigaleata]|uniref:Uncharacterized protein n=1 Tax=Syncephalis pseudoplumigaleata TaxID=1712513 RepID=A0A4P9Z3S0_9FUNG|nr:hypothetical protein SYNPS1DRAFT_27131 [Syncephalis pseudoplumigaleata]|eukprot:RKP27207.1 hypothetical protein SYNPS1DRAFT_27131 [Syncephalis pseudoplumigaleata]